MKVITYPKGIKEDDAGLAFVSSLPDGRFDDDFDLFAPDPLGALRLTIGAFGIGTTEFVIMGVLEQVAADLDVSIRQAGLLISGYALGVFVGAPLLTIASARWPRKKVLVALMVILPSAIWPARWRRTTRC
ncbi:hypothetical protein HORIV_17180 [Vreelandella olivaria]|uniref:Major facilitator superfamily (MFS) profile domain-containing protein n=1 Tax=Vreelandella olivaria TaxID=390919 RepID=A0ABM7GFS0_9GAMM|nr:hypothetical protein HORIV_17180 [Halomonas olivaria]